MPEGTDSGSPDAGTGSTAATGGGPDASQTICEQATTHDDLTWIQSNVFSASCARSTCHTQANQASREQLDQLPRHSSAPFHYLGSVHTPAAGARCSRDPGCRTGRTPCAT